MQIALTIALGLSVLITTALYLDRKCETPFPESHQIEDLQKKADEYRERVKLCPC